jgi:hypothetical protein
VRRIGRRNGEEMAEEMAEEMGESEAGEVLANPCGPNLAAGAWRGKADYVLLSAPRFPNFLTPTHSLCEQYVVPIHSEQCIEWREKRN